MFLKGVKFVKIYMVKLKIYMVKISMKVTYLNYLDFTQQTISVTTDVQIPLSENTGKKRGCLDM